MARRTTTTTRETELVYQVIAALAAFGIPAWRQNTGGRHNAAGRYVAFGRTGASDVLGIVPGSGRFLAIEVKTPGNEPTDAQRAYLADVQRAGGVAFWTDNVAAVIGVAPWILKGWTVTTAADGTQTLTRPRR